MKTKPLAFLLVLIVGAGEALAQTSNAPPTRTMASLMAEGYEQQTVQIFKDKIWMRRANGEGLSFICDRGRIGSPAFDAYRDKKYDQILCSVAQ